MQIRANWGSLVNESTSHGHGLIRSHRLMLGEIHVVEKKGIPISMTVIKDNEEIYKVYQSF